MTAAVSALPSTTSDAPSLDNLSLSPIPSALTPVTNSVTDGVRKNLGRECVNLLMARENP